MKMAPVNHGLNQLDGATRPKLAKRQTDDEVFVRRYADSDENEQGLADARHRKPTAHGDES